MRETSIHNQEWTNVRNEIKKVLDQANIKFNLYGVVIRYLEKACLKMDGSANMKQMKSLSGEFTRLKALHQDFESFFKETAIPHFSNFNLLEIVEMRPACINFAENL